MLIIAKSHILTHVTVAPSSYLIVFNLNLLNHFYALGHVDLPEECVQAGSVPEQTKAQIRKAGATREKSIVRDANTTQLLVGMQCVDFSAFNVFLPH